MPLTLLFFQSATVDDPLARQELTELLELLPGLEWEAAADAPYRPFRFHDPDTGAGGSGDLGRAPLEHDPMERPHAHDGWTFLDLAVHLPLCVPHWHCVEAARYLQGLLDEMPSLGVLDPEAQRRDEQGDPVGPGPLRRDRLLASWEVLHQAQVADLRGLPRMARLASISLWRYRRERADGVRELPEVAWPQGLVLGHGEQAQSAAIWPEAMAWALPPVEWLVVPRGEGAGLLPAAMLRDQIPLRPMEYGGADLVREDAALRRWRATVPLTAITSYHALADGDWID